MKYIVFWEVDPNHMDKVIEKRLSPLGRDVVGGGVEMGEVDLDRAERRFRYYMTNRRH